jgi:hypothetical protein
MSKLAVAAAVLAVALAAVQAAQTRSGGTTSACAHYTGHVYEVCFAYIFNDSSLALRNYYRLVHSPDRQKAQDAREDLLYRFRGDAMRQIVRRAGKWPAGVNDVSIPKITIVSAKASLASNRALLATRESWQVTAANGRVLFVQSSQPRRVTMCRIQGKLLHIWVVVKFSADPRFNCLGYPH